MAAQKVAGTAFFKIDGAQQSLRGKGKVKPSAVKRTPITNMDGTINYKEEPVAGEMELDLTTIPGFSAQSLNRIVNSTITWEQANGTTYILQAGFQIDELQIDSDEGICSVKFAGTVIEDN